MDPASIDDSLAYIFEGHEPAVLPPDVGAPHRWLRRIRQDVGSEAVWGLCCRKPREGDAGPLCDAIHPAVLAAMCASEEPCISRSGWSRLAGNTSRYLIHLLQRYDVGIELPDDDSLLSHMDLPHALARSIRVAKAYSAARDEARDQPWLNMMAIMHEWVTAATPPFAHDGHGPHALAEVDKGRVNEQLFYLARETHEVCAWLEHFGGGELTDPIDPEGDELFLGFDGAWEAAIEAGATEGECIRTVQQQRESHLGEDQEDYLAWSGSARFWSWIG